MYEQIEQYVRRILRESTPGCPFWNIESIKQGKQPHWNYIDGCMLTSLLTLHKITGEQRYFEFAERFVDFYVFDDGTIRGYDKTAYNLDDINEGKVLFELYRVTGKYKYKLAIDLLKSQLDEQPRTATGNFWHKLIYPDQVWLDGLYMAQGFSALWQKNFGTHDYSDVVQQMENVRKYMYDERKKNLDEFINEKGAICRGYIPRSRNMFSVTKEGFEGEDVPSVGTTVGIGAEGKLKQGETGLGTCVAVEQAGRYTYYVIQLS